MDDITGVRATYQIKNEETGRIATFTVLGDNVKIEINLLDRPWEEPIHSDVVTLEEARVHWRAVIALKGSERVKRPTDFYSRGYGSAAPVS